MTVLLYDELKKLAQERQVEIKKPGQPINQDDNWHKCRQAVLGFSDDITAIIKRAFNKKVLKAEDLTKGIKYTVSVGRIHGFEVEFAAFELKKGENAGSFKYAYYVAFNPKQNVCFKRDIVKNEADQLYEVGNRIFAS